MPAASSANARRISRLGGVLSATSLLVMILVGGLESEPLKAWNLVYFGILALQAMVGIGLLFQSRFARIGALPLFAFLGGLALWQCSEMMIQFVPTIEWTVGYALWLANAVATTTLLAWLSFRAIQIILDTLPATSFWTPRLIGVVLIIAGLSHLKAAIEHGFASSTSFSISISPLGTQLSGFFAWGVWHAAALTIGVLLLLPWQRLVSLASLFLVLLASLLFPAIWLANLRFHGGLDSSNWSFIAITGVLPLFLAYLSWWLAEEQGFALRRMSKRQGVCALAFLAIIVGAAFVVEGRQQKGNGRQQEYVDAMMARVKAEQLESEMTENLAAAPLHDAIIPSLKIWYCGSASTVTGNCDFYLENCEQANMDPCYEQLSAWCFTYRSDELGPEYFACYATESTCISSRYDSASRCEPYPARESDPP